MASGTVRNWISPEAIKKLARFGDIYQDKKLAEYSRWKIGGDADVIVAPCSAIDVAGLMSYISKERIPYVIIGSSSNLLFADEGLRALVILLSEQMSEIKISRGKVFAQCGGLGAKVFAKSCTGRINRR